TVSGGTGTNNNLTVQTNNPQTWMINANNGGVIGGIAEMSGGFNFGNIQNIVGSNNNDTFKLIGSSTIAGTITGGNGNNNTLVGGSNSNTWNINSNGINGLTGTGGFTKIQNLTGGSSDNTFYFGPNSSVSGMVDGGNS